MANSDPALQTSEHFIQANIDRLRNIAALRQELENVKHRPEFACLFEESEKKQQQRKPRQQKQQHNTELRQVLSRQAKDSVPAGRYCELSPKMQKAQGKASGKATKHENNWMQVVPPLHFEAMKALG